MQSVDYIILGIVSVLAVLALRSVFKHKTTCSGCSCCKNAHECAACQTTDTKGGKPHADAAKKMGRA